MAFSIEDIETHLAGNCTKILVWHTMTMTTKFAKATSLVSRYYGTNIEKLIFWTGIENSFYVGGLSNMSCLRIKLCKVFWILVGEELLLTLFQLTAWNKDRRHYCVGWLWWGSILWPKNLCKQSMFNGSINATQNTWT